MAPLVYFPRPWLILDAIAQRGRNTTDAMFATLLATAVDGIMVIDESGIVEVYNDACQRLFGYAPGDVIGNNIKMLMPQPYREAHDGYLDHHRTTGERRIIGIGREVRGRRKDGTTFPMYLSVGEGVVGDRTIYVGIVHDLTAQKAAEARLVEVQSELLHVSRLSDMGQMASALAHEMNQPLSAIMNYVNATRRVLQQGMDPAKALEFTEKASEQAGRAGQIIRNLRSFVEKREAARKQEDINAVVRDAVALGFVGAAADSNVAVSFDLAEGLPPVLIDRIQIQQVLINLIRNSVEAMNAVAKRALMLSTSLDDEGWVRVGVSDTGPGIEAGVMARLFRPFVTTKDTGMGIGLTICQSIIQAHDGRIWAMPNDGDGMTFFFRVPRLAG